MFYRELINLIEVLKYFMYDYEFEYITSAFEILQILIIFYELQIVFLIKSWLSNIEAVKNTSQRATVWEIFLVYVQQGRLSENVHTKGTTAHNEVSRRTTFTSYRNKRHYLFIYYLLQFFFIIYINKNQ